MNVKIIIVWEMIWESVIHWLAIVAVKCFCSYGSLLVSVFVHLEKVAMKEGFFSNKGQQL